MSAAVTVTTLSILLFLTMAPTSTVQYSLSNPRIRHGRNRAADTLSNFPLQAPLPRRSRPQGGRADAAKTGAGDGGGGGVGGRHGRGISGLASYSSPLGRLSQDEKHAEMLGDDPDNHHKRRSVEDTQGNFYLIGGASKLFVVVDRNHKPARFTETADDGNNSRVIFKVAANSTEIGPLIMNQKDKEQKLVIPIVIQFVAAHVFLCADSRGRIYGMPVDKFNKSSKTKQERCSWVEVPDNEGDWMFRHHKYYGCQRKKKREACSRNRSIEWYLSMQKTRRGKSNLAIHYHTVNDTLVAVMLFQKLKVEKPKSPEPWGTIGFKGTSDPPRTVEDEEPDGGSEQTNNNKKNKDKTDSNKGSRRSKKDRGKKTDKKKRRRKKCQHYLLARCPDKPSRPKKQEQNNLFFNLGGSRRGSRREDRRRDRGGSRRGTPRSPSLLNRLELATDEVESDTVS